MNRRDEQLTPLCNTRKGFLNAKDNLHQQEKFKSVLADPAKPHSLQRLHLIIVTGVIPRSKDNSSD